MIGISPLSLAVFVVRSFLLGVLLGTFYDVIRIQRVMLGVRYGGRGCASLYQKKFPLIGCVGGRQSGKGLRRFALNSLIFIQDVLFFLVAGVCVAVLVYYSNDGIVRALPLLTLVGGFLCYYFSFGKLVMLFSEWICMSLKIAFLYLFIFAFYPVRWLMRLAKRFFLLTYSALYCKILNERVKAFSDREEKRILGLSKSGFLE